MFRTSFLNPQKMPLAIEPDDRKADKANLDDLIETVSDAAARNFFETELLKCGALLFRGFQVKAVAEFEQFVRLFSGGAEFFSYAGGVSPRRALGETAGGGGAYTSTEYPAHLTLPLHNELSYADVYPRRLYFFCLVEPENGGATTLGDSRRILKNLDKEIVETFRRKKICYIRNLHPHKGTGYSWPEAFETDDPRAAEECCRKIGARFEWRPNGVLRLSQIRPATAAHPQTGEEVWFNQADGFHPSNLDRETYAELLSFFGTEDEFRLNATFGDGSPIDLAMLGRIREVISRETIPHRWRQGDILAVDNLLAAHGRAPFAGARKIALAMT
jgi:alpha-ketoglutarate-dependent taurine dioxygenase